LIEQQGKVVAVRDGRIRVRIGASAGCGACDAGKGCGAGLLGRLLRRKDTVLSFDNDIDAAVGQAVVVGLSEQVFLGLVSRLYLVPLLAALAGAVAAQFLAEHLQFSELTTDLAVLSGGVLAGFLAVRRPRVRQMDLTERMNVHLLRTVSCEFKDNEREVIS
jgi:sigma-E factor negative regulatory protein RseC